MLRDEHSVTDLFAAQQAQLTERLVFLLQRLHPALRVDVERALQARGKLLSKTHAGPALAHSTLPNGSWSLLTLLVAQYILPDIDLTLACNAALAVECFVCALDLLDDVEDEDRSPTLEALGTARILNVSTALLSLAQQALFSPIHTGAPAEQVVRFAEMLQATTLTAVTGQHQDLLAEQRPAQELTIDECIAIAAGKAGSLMRLACWLGAACAGADDVLLEQFSQLGELLGISHQLDNDSHDLYDLLQESAPPVELTTIEARAQSRKSDLTRNKKTLPVVIAASKMSALQQGREEADRENTAYLQALREGILASWGICLLYRERANDLWEQIEVRRPAGSALRSLLGL